MNILRIKDIFDDKILVSRESAHRLRDRLAMLLSESCGLQPVIVDFAGVQGVAPSFLDELITLFETVLSAGDADCKRSLLIANPPTRISLKFQAVARGHGMTVEQMADGAWLLSPVYGSHV